jgi:hypothetical protein
MVTNGDYAERHNRGGTIGPDNEPLLVILLDKGLGKAPGPVRATHERLLQRTQ